MKRAYIDKKNGSRIYRRISLAFLTTNSSLMKQKLFSYIFQIIFQIAVFFLVAIALNSCKDVYDIQPQDSVTASQMYRNVDDADAAVLGVYSKFLGIASQYVVLNELRADLLDVTDNASDYLKEINNHSVSEGNPYADPSPFYDVILNCNDVLKNFTIMRKELKFSQDEYDQRYSDIAAVRCWLYLQLAIHFGQVPYVTEPFEKVSDLKNTSKYPMVGLDAMIDSLINVMENIPYKSNYPGTATIMGISSGSYNTTPFFINKRLLLGDLYLWQGNYLEAASNYKIVMDLNGAQDYDTYKVKGVQVGGTSSAYNDLGINYNQRYNWADINGLINSNTQGWRSIFARTQDALYYQEWIWQLFFDTNTQPNSPFEELFANYGQGKYELKPSQQAIDYWNSQTQTSNAYGGTPYDARGMLSYSTSSGQPVVMKYLYEYDPLFPYKKPGRLFLYRAAGLQLRFSEAANRDNKCKLALAFLNCGIRREFGVYYQDAVGSDTVANLTDLMRTDGPFFNYTFPYNFNASDGFGINNYYSYRKSPKTGNDTVIAITLNQYVNGPLGVWYKDVGIRGRANLQYVLTDLDPLNSLALDPTDANKDTIEDKLIDECALELAFEGQRWGDLLRVARRRNDPSFLANKVYSKLLKAGNPNAEAVKTKLLKGDWFLPFKLK